MPDSSPRTTAEFPHFALADHAAQKRLPALIAADEQHFADIDRALARHRTRLTERLDYLRKLLGRSGREGVERDAEIRAVTGQLAALSMRGASLCLGRLSLVDRTAPIYLGRIGLTDDDGTSLLVDWRTPEATAFFAATLADPGSTRSRRRYRWAGDTVIDFWDELLGDADPHKALTLDDQSAFLDERSRQRTTTMSDVLATISADQDAAIRAGSRGALVVDGGPGTGKTVVALHRVAYLLHNDQRLSAERGGVLFIGPHDPYLAYVADVLPDLGTEGVTFATLADLTPEPGVSESDARVSAVKGSAELVAAIDAAVAFYETPPTEPLDIDTPWGEVTLRAPDWATAFAVVEPGSAHNEVREDIVAEVAEIVVTRLPTAPSDALRDAVAADARLRHTLNRAWPLLRAEDIVTDLWTVPAYLAHCAPELVADDRTLLRRGADAPWTIADLPLLDAARARLGDRSLDTRRRARAAAAAAERRMRAEVVGELIEAADDDEDLISQFAHGGLQAIDGSEEGFNRESGDRLGGPFAHIVVDEAQDLTAAQWAMLVRRCPSLSFTIAGDRAQSRTGFTESWQARLTRAGLRDVRVSRLTINYRTPTEVMNVAVAGLRAVLPDLPPTVPARSGGSVRSAARSDLVGLLTQWLANNSGVACVIGTGDYPDLPARARALHPDLIGGLEFDLVVLDDPATFGEGLAGAVTSYIAATRTTRDLIVLSPE